MGWMPPPDGIAVCHAGDVALPGKGEGIHGEGYDHWDRLGKAGLSGAWGGAGRPAGRLNPVSLGAIKGAPMERLQRIAQGMMLTVAY
jgi:hypothetical protein